MTCRMSRGAGRTWGAAVTARIQLQIETCSWPKRAALNSRAEQAGTAPPGVAPNSAAAVRSVRVPFQRRTAIPRERREKRSGQSFLPAGLCVEASLPVSVPLRFSIPVALVDGLGLCVELVMPMPSAEGEPATPFSPDDGAPPVSAARDTMLEPDEDDESRCGRRGMGTVHAGAP